MVPWWRIWEGIIAEYWEGAWRLVVDDLGGAVGAAISIPMEDHLLIGLDRILLQALAEEEDLVQVSVALRGLLADKLVNEPGLVAAWRLSPALEYRRGLWVGPANTRTFR